MVDLAHGEISREVYVNEGIYQQELEQIFARAWLFIGHESQVPKPGDYFQSRMGEEAVLLVRDRKGALHVFLNTCRHRGMKVCRYDEGNTLLFTCPFHGWSYDTDGRLVGVPEFQSAYHGELDKEKWGLPEARIANFYGSIWACWDPQAPSLEAYLGDFVEYLRPMFQGDDGRDAGVEMIGGIHKWQMPSNWKFPAISFQNDAAHGTITHRSVNVAAIGPQGDVDGGDRHPRSGGRPINREIAIPGLGHSSRLVVRQADEPYLETWLTEPLIEEYYREAHEAKVKRFAGQRLITGGGGVFPDMCYQGAGEIRKPVVVWHPDGVYGTECWRFYLIDSKAPKEVKDAMRRYYMRYAGPVGLTESDDMENWNYATPASKGTIARRYPYNYQMGLGHEYEDPSLAPGRLGSMRNEHGQRNRFARWLELMEAKSWADAYPVDGRPKPLGY
jgi:nitrite reductase/ring-hydroxylating ferredoxin subunit